MTRALHSAHLDMGHRSYMYVGKKKSSDPNIIEIPRLRGFPGLKRFTIKIERHFGFQYLYAPGFRKLCRMLPPSLDILHIHALYGSEGYADIGALPGLSQHYPTLLWLDDMWMLTGHCGYSFNCERWKIGCGQCPDLTIYPPIPQDGTRINWIRKKIILSRCQLHVATPSQWLIDKVKQSPLLRRFPNCVVHNGVDLTIFRPGSKRTARKALNLPEQDTIVLLVSNYMNSRFKGINHAIDALNGLKCGNLTVLLVGKDGDKVAHRLYSNSKPISYVKCREELAKCYQASDVFLMPSLEEVFGLVAAEAMACATPVVAYASGGLKEVIGNDGAGILVPTGDILGLTSAIQRLIKSREKATLMGQRAALRAKQLFDIRRQAESLIELYKQMIDSKRRKSV